MTINDFLNICDLAKAHGKQPGENMEDELLEYMKAKGQKPSCATELTKSELLQEYKSQGKSILYGSISKAGELNVKIEKGEKTDE